MSIEVQIVHTSGAILYSNTTEPFLILNLIGNYFLLTKASLKQTLGKNINFKINGKEFYSTFLRHVNLSYAGKLSELIDNLSIAHTPGLQHHWLLLYEIHDFLPEKQNHYQIGFPPYGEKVVIHRNEKSKIQSRISNLFKLNGQAFYFMDCTPSCCDQFNIITNEKCSIVYGITYFVKDVTVCIPFHSISSQKMCPINIPQTIKPLLEGTCYIFYGGNYCTGFVLNQQTVVSARHMLPFQNQKIGVEVGVRFYPYHEERIGHVSKVGQGSVDVVVVNILDKLLVKNQTAQIQKGTSFRMKVDDEKLVGQPILALGFGKYSFSPRIFHKVEVVMPTIESGIVSKVIKVGHSNVFIKTDAVLYNGFSGCGIWLGSNLIGMAVFILKNKTNHSNFNHHNFSYCLDFILELLNGNKKEHIISDRNAQLQYFDKIQTRHRLTLIPKL